jgi:hypothetical protein
MRTATERSLVLILALVGVVGIDGCREADSAKSGENRNASANHGNRRVVLRDELTPEEQKEHFGWLFGDAETMERMRTAERVIAYRVGSKPLHSLPADLKARAKSGEEIGKYPVLDEPVEMTREDAHALLDYLLDGTNLSGMHAMCKLEPGVAARFVSGDSPIDVLICFKCGQVGVHHGIFHGSGDYKGLTTLLSLFQKLFPNDKELKEFSN